MRQSRSGPWHLPFCDSESVFTLQGDIASLSKHTYHGSGDSFYTKFVRCVASLEATNKTAGSVPGH